MLAGGGDDDEPENANFKVVSGNEKDGVTLLFAEDGKEYRIDEDGLVYEKDDVEEDDPIGAYDWEERTVDM